MDLSITVSGRSCDLALHPVSPSTARTIQEKGSEVYKGKPLSWWRKGKTSTCGMKVDQDTAVIVRLDGRPVQFDTSGVTADPLEVRRRMFLDSKANWLCVLGYDNEVCSSVWTWKDVEDFDPRGFGFMVQKWDRIMKSPDYYILDEVLYQGRFADEHTWCEECGFTLLEPQVIDLQAVRREWAAKDWNDMSRIILKASREKATA